MEEMQMFFHYFSTLQLIFICLVAVLLPQEQIQFSHVYAQDFKLDGMR